MAASGGHWSNGNFKPAAGTVAKAPNGVLGAVKSQLQGYGALDKAGRVAAAKKLSSDIVMGKIPGLKIVAGQTVDFGGKKIKVARVNKFIWDWIDSES